MKHTNLLKFAGVASIFILTVIYAHPSYSSNSAPAGDSQLTGSMQPAPAVEKGADRMQSPNLNASQEESHQSSLNVQGWQVPELDFVAYMPAFVPGGLVPDSGGVVDRLGTDIYYVYYQLNGKPVMEIYQAPGLTYDWDDEPEEVDLSWGRAELGRHEIDNLHGISGWVALVRPYADRDIQVPNVVVVLKMPEKKIFLEVVRSLQPVAK